MPESGRLRQHFLLRDDVTFLNHGSFGACPAEVFEVYQAWQLELEREPVEFLGRRLPHLMLGARRALSGYLACDEDELVFVHNATTAINTVARSLPLAAGDEILATNLEYGALDRAWDAVCRDRGSRYVRMPVSLPVGSREDVADEIWSGVTDRTKVLFISHITSTSALTLPVELLIPRARERGITTVIDGAHVPGQIPLDLHALGADFYTGNCHKWMMTPKGCAFLYAHRSVQYVVRPIVVSWGDNPLDTTEFVRELEFQGTNDFASYLSIEAAIGFMQRHDWSTVRQRCHLLVDRYRERMRLITGLPSLSPDGTDWYSQMSSHPLPECDGDAFQRTLFDEYRIEIPVMRGPSGESFLRISVQGYNTIEDVDRLLAAVSELQARLVPGYDA